MDGLFAHVSRYWKTLARFFVVLGILTVFPWSASRPNHVGYYSVCSFAPISTLMFLVIAAVFCSFGKGTIRRCYGGIIVLVVISGLSAYWAYSVKLPMDSLQVDIRFKSIAFYNPSVFQPENHSLISFNWTFHNPTGQDTAAFSIEDFDFFVNGKKILQPYSAFPSGSNYGRRYLFSPFTIKAHQTLTDVYSHISIYRNSTKIEGDDTESIWKSLTQGDFNITLRGILVSRTNFGIIEPSPVIIVARPLSISCSCQS